jgi:hypothetical protein
MMRAGVATSITLALLVLLGSGGCGGKASDPNVGPTVPVQGKVTYMGQPLAGGTIQFEPDRGREASGTIGPDGTFTLTTFNENDGAVVGTHRVAATGVDKAGSPLPNKFSSFNTSKIEVEVTAGKTDYTIDFK